MPPTPSAAKPKAPGGKKPSAPPAANKGSGLRKKVGPLPLWVWVAGAAGAVALFFIMRRPPGEASPVELVSGGGSIGPTEQASAGAPSGNGAPASQLDPSVLDQIFSDQQQSIRSLYGDYRADFGDLSGQVTDLQRMFDDAALGQYADGGSYFTGADATVAATLGAPGTKPAPRKQQGPVQWGGSVYGAGLGDLFVREQLKPKGVNPGSWAKKHPQAAQYLGVSAQAKPAPARRPAAAPKPAPKKTQYATFKKDVKLKQGQKLKFAKGKGYYAG